MRKYPPNRYDIDFNDQDVLDAMIENMIAKTPVAYIVLDRDYRVRFINDYFLELRKLKKDEVMGVHCYSLSNGGKPCPNCAVREAIAEGRPSQVLRRDVLPDGSVRHIDDRAVPLYKEDGESFDYILELMINRNAEMDLREKADQAFYRIVETLVSILGKKDAYTSDHSKDVSAISCKLAKYIGLSDGDIHRIGLGALLHDIGKVEIADAIINKAGPLDDDEFMAVKSHPGRSFELLSGLKGSTRIKQMSRHHHERWDGRGYPEKLAGEEIPMGARIVALADTYDAMTSDRSYRKGLSHETALAEIAKNAGSQFDPDLAAKFCEMSRDLFNSRKALICKDYSVIDDFLKSRRKDEIGRSLKSAIVVEKDAHDERDVSSLAYAHNFIEQIFKHTPAYYTVVGEAFDVLYVSDSIAEALHCAPEDLIGKKCFEINKKHMSCFQVKNGVLRCPVVRAFKSGREELGDVTERYLDNELHLDIHAVPITLKNRRGESIKCAMEILFDRTQDVLLRKRMEEDKEAMVLMLEKLIRSVDPEATGNAAAILEECDSFGEFVKKFTRELDSDFSSFCNA